MKSNQKKETDTSNNGNIKKGNPSLSELPVKGNNKSKNEGEEFIGEGHGHDYSTPVAGEDGGTEEQPDSKSKKSSNASGKNQHAAQGKTPGEKPGI